MARHSVLVFSFSWLATDPRVIRQVESLASDYSVTTLGYGPPPSVGEEKHMQLNGLTKFSHPQHVRATLIVRLLRAFFSRLSLYRVVNLLTPGALAAIRFMKSNSFDKILGNELDVMPVILAARANSPVLLDLHEYTPGHLEPGSAAHYFFQGYKLWLCRNFLYRAKILSTVSAAIAEEYQREYQVPRVHAIRNIPNTAPLVPSEVIGDFIEICYHGLFGESRGIFEIIDSLNELPKFRANFIIQGDGAQRIQAYASNNNLLDRVRIFAPVGTREIVATINQFDIGIVLFKPKSRNHEYALPNKFFESIHASLMLVVGPTRDLASLVQTHKLGIVTDGFDSRSIVRSLKTLSRQSVENYKSNVYSAAENFGWQSESELLKILIEELR